MASKGPDDPILKRFRAAVTEIYGDRVSRVVLFGSPRAATRSQIPITTWRCFCATFPTGWEGRLADVATDILYSEGQFIHAMPYRADAYNETTPLMHEIRADGIDL